MNDITEPRRHFPGRTRRLPARYDRDLYSWAVQQAALLRAGRLIEADAGNIAEELDDVGSEQYNKLESALRIILLHLVKWDHQPARRSRSWWASITLGRNQVRRVLRKNPGLKRRLDEAITAAYEDARVQAAAQTRLGPRTFPARCPFSRQQLMEREIACPVAE